MELSVFNNSKLSDHEVRLFPSIYIRGEKEPEMRATAALLAMVRAVSEFGGIIIKQTGGPGGKAKNVECLTEVSFLPDFPEDNDPARPDGIIRRKYGKKIWTAFVEVKVGKSEIDKMQVNKYLKWANSLDFDALITISNQITRPNGDPPYNYNRRIKKVKVKHFSWEKIHSIVQNLCGIEQNIEDLDQKWMLEQFDKYLADDNSRIIAPPSFGKHWHSVLKNAKQGTLRTHKNQIQDVIQYWFAFLRVASFKIGAKMGQDVRIRIPRKYKTDSTGFINESCNKAIDTGYLIGELIFPGMKDIKISVNLRSTTLHLSHEVLAPQDGRRDRRVRWIIRELKKQGKIPKSIRIKIDWKQRGLITCEDYENLTEGINPLLRGEGNMQVSKDVMPKYFIIEYEKPLTAIRGKGSIEELRGVQKDLEDFTV
ncbi:hypothetical protein CEE37_06840 [candidate division LCP-89 bacterium B3_LCP]|uniref:Uncharacterized protein n=1 Tax=candidate division LCP-89 bacterium B3_LCP TaxID=2012998 RepID=A0A532V0D8_UNCL8|nr:MAG: hypothetical protein CEE37_06840 [candidate division LCP-89 bacterium B3_LCP]